ncbi:hypothetical protein LCAA2362_1916 [Lacticaseibacillus casei A2-362]|nr:hypothetical protein LCAA2362_1916 [Lacticaseibacillus casei A2-362]
MIKELAWLGIDFFDKSSDKSDAAHNERHSRPFQVTNPGLASQLPYAST